MPPTLFVLGDSSSSSLTRVSSAVSVLSSSSDYSLYFLLYITKATIPPMMTRTTTIIAIRPDADLSSSPGRSG
jgi:hypothetical protein